VAALLTGCIKKPGEIVSVKTKTISGTYTNSFNVGDTIIAEAAISDQNFTNIYWQVFGTDVLTLISSDNDNTNAMFVALAAGSATAQVEISNCKDNGNCRTDKMGASVTVQ
jgi:hypothetical protein